MFSSINEAVQSPSVSGIVHIKVLYARITMAIIMMTNLSQ